MGIGLLAILLPTNGLVPSQFAGQEDQVDALLQYKLICCGEVAEGLKS